MLEDENPNTLINSDLMQKAEGKFSRIELFHRGNAYRVKESDLPFYIGRDPRVNTLSVDKDVVSRIHCVVEIKDDQIGILDRSTNGTVVKVGEASSVIIRDEFYPLTGKGCLSLGEQYSSDQSEMILFKVVMEL
ncbi:MAG: FHA domain-containing protein [Agarilytica sp.]